MDLGVLPSPGTSPDLAALAGVLVRILGTEQVDVADLGRSSALLRFRAARDGVAVLEREPGTFLRFREEAVRFWCDAGPVIRAAQNDVLARLAMNTDRELLAERAASVLRHLDRVAEHLPADPAGLAPLSSATDLRAFLAALRDQG